MSKTMYGFSFSRTISLYITSVVCVLILYPCSCTTVEDTKNLTCTTEFPAMFAFGDSIVDAGNNNDRVTLIKCNFPPNGKDFDGSKATGRFCNGRLTTDFLIEKFGIKKNLPAYLDKSLKIEDLLTGVSFASAGSGYDHQTSAIGNVYSIEDQINMFEEYCEKLIDNVGIQRTDFIISNSIFFVVAGSCDLANTYFTLPFRKPFYDVDSYTDLMLNRSISFFEKLYQLGVRKIAVSNVPPIGYLPVQRTLAGGLERKCPEHHNEATQLFNKKLKDGLEQLSATLDNSTLIYVDTYGIFLDLVVNSTKYGFKVVDRACCGSGLVEVAVLCNPFSLVCDQDYLFWDSFHPSEKAYSLMAKGTIERNFPQYA